MGATPLGVLMFGLPGCPNHLMSVSHHAFAILWRHTASMTQSGSLPDSMDHMATSLHAHCFMASFSILVGLAVSLGTGHVVVPLK